VTISQPPLDPRKYPWHRGDVVTLDFKKSGFVLGSAPNYLEVMWMPSSVTEKVEASETGNLVRVAHAASLAAKGDKTNLEVLEDMLALHRVEAAIRDRIASCKTEADKESVNRLIARSFATDGCKWDKEHKGKLFELAITPSSVGALFKLQERIHRLSCKNH
jgi:hypothetical protein